MKLLSNPLQRHLYNPAMGLIPILLFSLLENFIMYRLSLGISLVTALIFTVLSVFQMKKQIYNFMSFISLGVISIFVSLLLFPEYPHFTDFTPILLEAILLLIVVLIRRKVSSILSFFRKHIKPKELINLRNSFDEFLVVIKIYYVVFIFRFTTLIAYISLPSIHTDSLDNLVYNRLGFVLIVCIIVYEHIRLRFLSKELKQELWLPVVDENGKVIGKIAESAKSERNSDMLHPIVRVVFEFEGKLYLSQDEESNMYNWAIEELVPYGITPEQLINNILEDSHCGNNLGKPRLLMTHIEKSETINKFVILYAVRVSKEEFKLIDRDGKYWLTSQIRQNIDSGIFPESFIAEFEFVCNTILFEYEYQLQEEV
ncbi:MAG: hypothetical protein ACRC6R_02870 [Bacteroidales bacterium]